jgi:trans-2,3-dihydro-3-hydroxyanthranilate isomerase
MKYYLLNVFTKDSQNGNQLAAVFPEQELEISVMQKLAREFNFSETIFFNHLNHKSIRIFTPNGELPFAGHPTVGAAWLLNHLGKEDKNFLVEVKLGSIEVEVSDETFITYPGQPKVSDFDGDLEGLLKSSNLDFADTDIEKIRMVDVGNVFTIIPLTSMAALNQAVPPVDFYDKSIKSYYIFKTSNNSYSVRMFAPGISINEDAATGSAACALGGYLKGVMLESEGNITLTQGTEMKRECELKLRWQRQIQVGGKVHLWGEGILLKPEVR